MQEKNYSHPSYYSMSEWGIPQIKEAWDEIKVTDNEFLILDFINCLIIGTTDTKKLQNFYSFFGKEILEKFKEITNKIIFRKGNFDSFTPMGKLDRESWDSLTKIQTISRILNIEIVFSAIRMQVWEMKIKGNGMECTETRKHITTL